MRFQSLLLSAVLLVICCTSLQAQSGGARRVHDPDAKFGTVTAPDSITLADAVAQLNKISEQHTLGKSQEPLTADEVTGAIRRWSNAPAISDETKAKFDRIAETGVLGKGDELQFATGLWSDGTITLFGGLT